jgi:hypothetical protein
VAEIRVERKRRPVWLWVVALVIVALLAWAAYDYFVADDSAIRQEDTELRSYEEFEAGPTEEPGWRPGDTAGDTL